MNVEMIDKALSSTDDGQALLLSIDDSVAAWMADSALDGDELKELLAFEAHSRHLIESEVIPESEKGANVYDTFPGATHVMLGWLHLVDLVLSLEVQLKPFKVSDTAKSIIGTPASHFVMRKLANFPYLYESAGFKTSAALIYLGMSDVEEVNHLLDVMTETNQEYGDEVGWCVGDMEDAIHGVGGKGPALLPMHEFLKMMEESQSKDYHKHYRSVPQTLLDQGFVSATWATDLDLKMVHLLFGENTVSISHEKTGTRYIRREDVSAIVLGSATERQHSGFSHTDYHKWTMDIYTHSGAIHHYRMTLSSGNKDANPQRERLTKVFNEVGKYYPVTSSGHHSVSESGYQTTMSYWF